MNTNTFWKNAVRYGAILGVAAIAVDTMALFRSNMILSIGWLILYIVLIYLFTKRQAQPYVGTEEGFSYGRCWGFIVAMMLFSGLLEGIYMGVAVNHFLAGQYDQSIALTLSTLETTGFYTSAMIDQISSLLHSPVVLILSNILGSVIKGAFFGLFVAAFTKVEPRPFSDNTELDA